ncbi:DUF5999 family protein [Streptomyces sp. 8N616]|uniref:DUF5999 family protein n=1 Tax=Streptomyces sp. 8N616 TaxID=3457414 RepID=UPI003FD6BE17
MYQHQQPCPLLAASDHDAACLIDFHPEHGRGLTCHGVRVFASAGDLLPEARVACAPPGPHRPGGMRTPAAPAATRAVWLLPPDPSSVSRARSLARTQLSDWALREHTDDTELLVSELVTNALRHAWGPIRFSLSQADGALRCEVEDTEPDPPQVCQAEDDDETGRGLQLLDALACRWGCERTPTGKIVWFELMTSATTVSLPVGDDRGRDGDHAEGPQLPGWESGGPSA